MAAAGRHPHPPPSSSLGGSLGRPKSAHLLLHVAGRGPPPPHLRLKAPPAAISDPAVQLAFDAPASAGDFSVLVPISMVLLIVYWVANFVVPEMISKDLQPGESSEDIVGETNAKVDEKVATPSKPTGQSNKLRGGKRST